MIFCLFVPKIHMIPPNCLFSDPRPSNPLLVIICVIPFIETCDPALFIRVDSISLSSQVVYGLPSTARACAKLIVCTVHKAQLSISNIGKKEHSEWWNVKTKVGFGSGKATLNVIKLNTDR